MISTARKPGTSGRPDDWVDIAFGSAISTLAIIDIVVPLIPVLIAWQAAAIIYLVVLFVFFRNRTTRTMSSAGRPLPNRVLEYLTWVLPIVASVAGITSGVRLLSSDVTDGTGDSQALIVGLLSSVSVVVAWFLLQVGFAEIYESVYERVPDAATISFPGADEHPALSDFLYMSFTVGTSFAISGATIASRAVRRVVLIQSVTAFFYNAFLIAVAIQVIQGIIAKN